MDRSNRILGSLIGGAIGDALGAPVEFMSLETIKKSFGPSGIVDFFPAYGRIGAITDDTQMTLFTAEGLLRAYVRARSRGMCNVTSVVSAAYHRWLETQEKDFQFRDTSQPGWLYHVEALWSQRAPGLTCLSALRSKPGSVQEPVENDSKGAGAIMRIGPVAMLFAEQDDKVMDVFNLAEECAWVTHGHPTGYLSAAAFAVILHALLCQKSLHEGIAEAKRFLTQKEGSKETLDALEKALKLAQQGTSNEDAIHQIGEGWVAEEALGIAIYCALKAKDFEDGLILAVNHDGDSDTTGLLVGEILGAIYGYEKIPQRWIDGVELRDEIMQIGHALFEYKNWDLDDEGIPYSILLKYPGA